MSKEKESKSKLQQTLNQYGGNIQPILDELKKGRDKVLALKNKRDDINAQIGEVRAGIKALGISKKAFDHALTRFEMDPEKRDQLDADYDIACEGMGVPLKQTEMDLQQSNQKEDENAEANKQADINAGQNAAVQAA